MPYTVLQNTHKGFYVRLAEMGNVVYTVLRCGMKSHCVGGTLACAGPGGVPAPPGCRVNLVSPKINNNICDCLTRLLSGALFNYITDSATFQVYNSNITQNMCHSKRPHPL